MKHLIVAFTLLSASLLAQPVPGSDIPTPSSPANGPSYSQLYCSGFVSRRALPKTNYVLGSKESPHENRFLGRSVLFLGGPDLVAGRRYSLLRQVSDPNQEASAPEQERRLSKLGALYEDLGWVTVQSVEKGAAVASFDFSCDTAVPGDIVVPYEDRPTLSFRTIDPPLDSFHGSRSAVHGHILGSRGFVDLLGTGMVVYTDFGGKKGVKPGDYLLVMRGYAPGDLNKVDRASEQLPKGAEATSADPVVIKDSAQNRFPVHVLGELLVLRVTPESSTAMITRSFAEMELGDLVETETETDQSAAAAPAPEPAPAPAACHPQSRLRRLVPLHRHDCKPAKAAE